MKQDLIKKHLIQTFLSLARQKPYHKVTIKEIAKESETSYRLFYHYFDAKKEIYTEGVLYMFGQGRKKSETARQCFDRILSVISDNQNFIMQANRDIELRTLIYNTAKNEVEIFIKKRLKKYPELDLLQSHMIIWISFIFAFMLLKEGLFLNNTISPYKYEKDIQLIRRFFASINMEPYSDDNLFEELLCKPAPDVSDKRLADSLMSITKVKSFDEITIEEIVKESNLSKATFYNKYVDKMALRNEVWLSDVLKIISNTLIDAAKGKTDKENIYTLPALKKYYLKNRNLYVFSTQSFDYLLNYIIEYFRLEISNRLDKLDPKQECSPYIAECIAKAFTYYSTGITMDYISADYKKNHQSSEDINLFIQDALECIDITSF